MDISGLQYKIKPQISIISQKTGKVIGALIPDIIVEDKIIVEIKALKDLRKDTINQLIKYLELSKYEVGYLVNFGRPYTQIIRKVYSNNRKNLPNLNSSADIREPIADR